MPGPYVLHLADLNPASTASRYRPGAVRAQIGDLRAARYRRPALAHLP
jgi:hypothetical protein